MLSHRSGAPKSVLGWLQVRDMMSQLFGRALKKMASLAAPKVSEDDLKTGALVHAAPAAIPNVISSNTNGDQDDEAEQLLYEDEEGEEDLRRAAQVSVAATSGHRPKSESVPAEEDAEKREDGAVTEGAEEEEEEDEAEEEADYIKESDGRFSPPPVDRVLFSGQDIIPEEEDLR
jgi:type IV secretory pathway VirB10-like protein